LDIQEELMKCTDKQLQYLFNQVIDNDWLTSFLFVLDTKLLQRIMHNLTPYRALVVVGISQSKQLDLTRKKQLLYEFSEIYHKHRLEMLYI
jgi:hypothetical protein